MYKTYFTLMLSNTIIDMIPHELNIASVSNYINLEVTIIFRIVEALVDFHGF